MAERENRYACDTLHCISKKLVEEAEEKGIDVKQINPENTSKRCSKCGHIDRNNRHREKFECQNCGYELHADYNASKNIGIKLLQRRQKSSAGTGHGQLALKSGTLKLNGNFTPPRSMGQKWSSLTIYLNSCPVEFNRYLEFSAKILR